MGGPRKSFGPYPPHGRLIMMTYIVALAIGTATHLTIILHGWRAPHHPLLNTYWTSPAVLNRLTIVLLVRALTLGMPLALIVPGGRRDQFHHPRPVCRRWWAVCRQRFRSAAQELEHPLQILLHCHGGASARTAAA